MKLSELAWNLADYEAAGEVPPARVRSNPELTEGAMMSTEEIETYLKDSLAMLRILADKNSPRYDDLVSVYEADLAYLMAVGSIDEDDYNELTDEANLRFPNT